ncbi:SRPBCC family protein [Mycobacterium sp. TNTM28]|uniref:SRPBCC family protein n=1 Tax=[Mycobacterium] fortunisiensis TaxID=2600579 RepID=A0ABS6KMH5_9MYCO|nr:SRPBCC family protein [[Mycobacterium] fortunisiensis]MBU9764817.1 SRPBCC family protein [[Mycobacterium] fortunisiensis]
MQTVTVERTIAAPPEAVFDFLSNAANFTRSPLVLRQRLAEPGQGAPYGQGALRILFWVIGWFRERITAYDAPRSFDYSVERSFPPSEHRFGRVSFAAVDGGTHVTWTTTFRVKFPLIGGVLTRWVGRPVLSRVFNDVLDAAATDLVNR